MDSKLVEVKPKWKPSVLISTRLQLHQESVHNVIDLLEEGATLPFIARYRKDQTGNMSPDLIREVASQLEELSTVESKISNVHSSISKLGKMTPDLLTSLTQSTSLQEVEALYAPFKPGHKGSYAERAKALGLGEIAMEVLKGRHINLGNSVNQKKKGLETVGDIEKGVKHIIADIVAKDKELMDFMREFCNTTNVLLETTKAKAKPSKEKDSKVTKATKAGFTKGKDQDIHKFEQYMDFKVSTHSAKPHQILAINRGEDLHFLSVKISIPETVKHKFLRRCTDKFLVHGRHSPHQPLYHMACTDAYDRLVEPAMMRHIRSDLTKAAERASISVFTSNLHSLLLMPPVKHKTILGLDPGFKNGCKFAVISATGEVLTTGVAYLHDYKSNKTGEVNNLLNVILKFRCEIVAIGNGVACRETEQIISDLIKSKNCSPLNVVYCIVDECGASIYSVSPEAQAEMPDMDHTLRGAVSIGRRLQDPLAELVKIEPKNLGVGMYQHDLNKKQLDTALSSVVEECVSFVGVDLNTCSQCLLRRVSGLNAAKAKKILEWRSQHGPFTSRGQLMGVKGLGKKGFEQCAGFVRVTRAGNISPDVKEELDVTNSVKPGQKRKAAGGGAEGTSKKKAKKQDKSAEWNPLDCTSVHPESYSLADKLMEHLSVDINDIGTAAFISKVCKGATDNVLQTFSDQNKAGISTVRLITEALQQPLTYDIRDGAQKPIFKQEVMSVSDLKRGSNVTGRVTNVTHFGAFVDIGVGINGLVHCSKMGRWGKLGVGDCVEVKVESVEVGRGRIALALVNVQGR